MQIPSKTTTLHPSQNNIDPKFLGYPTKVLSGEIIAGELIKLQCRRYLSLFDRDDLYFDPERAERPIKFISHLKHWQGSQFVGTSFELQEWQKWMIYNIYGWIKKSDNTRLIRQAYLQISRKNGKTSLCAALALYALIADNEPGAEVDVVAPSSAQSHIALTAAQNYGTSINKHNILKYRNSDILFDHTHSKLKVMSSDSKYGDGFNSSTAIIDEFHAFRDSAIFNLITSSMGARKQPLLLLISTAGFDLYSFCKQYRDTCVDILKELKTDDTIAPFIFEMDSDDNWEDPINWPKCCPALDITVSKEYMQEQLTKAKNMTSEEAQIKTKTFNLWVSSSSVWIPEELITNASEHFDIFDMFNNCESAYAFAGIDLASNFDMTSLTIMLRTSNGEYYFKTHCFLPESALNDAVNKDKYREWAKQGYLDITPGNVTDYDYVLARLVEINEKLPLTNIAYDSWNSSQFVISCTEQGLPMKPFAQNLGSFNKPTREFERLLVKGKIHLEYNPIVNWCFSNATLKIDKVNNNAKPIKSGVQKSGNQPGKIDAVITILESLGIMLADPNMSPYFEVL